MNITAIESRYNLKIQPIKTLIDELTSRIEHCERTFNISSSDMLKDLKQNKVIETLEICNWMIDVQVLKQLQETSREIESNDCNETK